MAITTMQELRENRRWLLDFYQTDESLYPNNHTDTWNNYVKYWPGWNASVIPVATTPGATCTKATPGCIQFPDAPSGKKWHLGSWNIRAVNNRQCGYYLFDRLWHCSGFVGNSTSVQNVNSLALPRYTTGEGVQMLVTGLGGSSAWGATPTNITVNYTNSAGTAGRVGNWAYTATMSQNFMYQNIQLQAGDTGIRSLQSIQLAGSTGAAGNATIILARRIAVLAQKPYVPVEHDFFRLGATPLEQDCCLWMTALNNVGNTGACFHNVVLVEG